MTRTLPVLVLVLILPVLILTERALKAVTHRHRPRKRHWAQLWVGLAGVLVAVLITWPLRQSVGKFWAADIQLLVIGLWLAAVDVLIFGVPDRVAPTVEQ